MAGADASPEQGQCAARLAHRPALGETGPVRIRRFSQARTLRRKDGPSSRLGRVFAAGARNRQVFCATSRLGRDSPVRAEDGRGVLAGRGVGPSRRLSQAGILRRPISPEQGRCAGIAPIPGRKAGVSPKPRRCALEFEHRPVLGETGSLHVGRFSQAGTLHRKNAQSSLLGRILAAGARNRPHFCATSRLGRNPPIRAGEGRDVSPGRGVGPSRRLSQSGILRRPISPKQGRCARIACFSGRKVGASPKQGRCAAKMAYRPALGETAPGRTRRFSRARTLRTRRYPSSRLRRGGPTGRWASPTPGRCAGMVRVSGRSPRRVSALIPSLANLRIGRVSDCWRNIDAHPTGFMAPARPDRSCALGTIRASGEVRACAIRLTRSSGP